MTHDEKHRIIDAERDGSNTCDHIHKKIPDPVRSPIVKLVRGQLVAESVTISEYCLLHVFLASIFVAIVSGVAPGTVDYLVDTKRCLHGILFCPLHNCTWPHPAQWFLSARPRANSDDLASFGRSITTYARAQSRRRALVFNVHTTLRCCGLQAQATSFNGSRDIHVLGVRSQQTGLALQRWIQEVVSAPLSALAHLPAYAMQ